MSGTKPIRHKIWSPTIIILTITMLILFIITAYFGFISGLLWAVSLGVLYGILLALSYHIELRKKRRFNILYIVQAASVFIIIMIFVGMQRIFGPSPYAWDYFVLAFSMLFAGGLMGIPVVRYTRIKFAKTANSKTKQNEESKKNPLTSETSEVFL